MIGIGCFVILVLLASMGIILITGDGAFKKKFTMSGIVEIQVANDKATCFVDADAHGISCLPNWFIDGNINKQ